MVRRDHRQNKNRNTGDIWGRSWNVAYSRFRPEAPIGAHRAYVRTVAPK